MHKTHNTLALLVREQSTVILNRHLAAALDLQAQFKQAHWNVRGPDFFALHGLFDKLAREVADNADQLVLLCHKL